MRCINIPGVVFRAIVGAGSGALVTLSLAWRCDERSNIVRNFVSLVRSQASAEKSRPHLAAVG